MPLTFEVTYEDDSKQVVRLPVEAWAKSDKITRTTQGIEQAARSLPDAKRLEFTDAVKAEFARIAQS